jgi:hypothetical protein
MVANSGVKLRKANDFCVNAVIKLSDPSPAKTYPSFDTA